ncbi:MAG: hypothetical protein ACU0BS_00825 [Hasllibacter sp.]
MRRAIHDGGDPQFYGPVLRGLRRRGARVRVLPSEEGAWAAIPPDGDPDALHVVHNGRLRAPGVLNAAIAYVDRWWHLDPSGVLCRSSVAADEWDPAATPRAAARAFFADLRARHVATRRSRYSQPREAASDLPEGCIAVFLQGRSPLTEMARRFSTQAMIKAACRGGGGRPVRVKPHPQRSHLDELLAVTEMAEEGHDIDLYEGNLHDLLAACAATVSISSAGSFEGFLHRKPAILFGHSDFHHYAHAVPDQTPEGFAATLARALVPRRTYAHYVHWYLKGHCLNAGDPRLMRRVLARMRQVGWDAGRLGIADRAA